jgi:phospholipid N-methyltransferase
LRTIVKEHRFEAELRKLHPDAQRADEFIEGAEITLARDPMRGTQSSIGSVVWFLPMNDVPNHPALNLYYCFDEDCVWLMTIRPAL